jgi:hypothetical protein
MTNFTVTTKLGKVVSAQTLIELGSDLAALKALSDAEFADLYRELYQGANERNDQIHNVRFPKDGPNPAEYRYSSVTNWKPETYEKIQAAYSVECVAFYNVDRESGYNWGRENRRRQTNATRAANAEKRAAQAVQTGTYTVGEEVEVHAFGYWYRGTVTKLGRTGKVTVKYTSGTGSTREKAVDSTKIRKLA